MATVDLFLNGRVYQVACDNGQEAHVKALAERFEARMKDLSAKLGPAPETTLMLLAALMTEDELHTVKKLESFGVAAASYPAKPDRKRIEEMEKTVAETIDGIAARIERIAEGLEKN